eukprot:PITA_26519
MRTRREMRLTAQIGEYEMDQVILDLRLDANVLPKQTWERMGRPTLQWYPIQLQIENQQKILPMGRLQGITVDIEGASALENFKVIEIVDDNNPYLTLLGIDWATDMNGVINLKKRKIIFEKNSLGAVVPLDPTKGSHYTEPLIFALECYNVNTEEDDEDLQKVNITETEGYHEVQGPLIEYLNITPLVKTKQVNIGTEAKPKYATLDDFWDDATVDKVVEILHEYQDLFPTNIMDLKGIIEDLGMMRITLKPNVKPVKQRPYHLNPKYKEKVCIELDKMLAVGIIEPVEESNWLSPMVV